MDDTAPNIPPVDGEQGTTEPTVPNTPLPPEAPLEQSFPPPPIPPPDSLGTVLPESAPPPPPMSIDNMSQPNMAGNQEPAAQGGDAILETPLQLTENGTIAQAPLEESAGSMPHESASMSSILPESSSQEQPLFTTEMPQSGPPHLEATPPPPPPPNEVFLTEKPEPPSSPPPKPSSSKIFLVVGIMILIVVVGAGGLVFLQSKGNSKEATVVPTPAIVPTEVPKILPLTLAIASPQEGEIGNGQITITGKTTPTTAVLVFSDTAATSVEADGTGAFTTTLTLGTGLHDLTIEAVNPSLEQKSEVRKVLSTQDLFEGAKNALIGTVASIVGQTVTIATKDGQQAVTIDSKTKIYAPDGTLARQNAIKAGLSIAAVATASGVVQTATESATTPVAKTIAAALFLKEASVSGTSVFVGTITGINEGIITLREESNGGENFYTLPTSSSLVMKTRGNQVTSIDALKLLQKVAVIGTVDTEGNLTAKLLHILSL